jgi:hypothetical protein
MLSKEENESGDVGLVSDADALSSKGSKKI